MHWKEGRTRKILIASIVQICGVGRNLVSFIEITWKKVETFNNFCK